MSSLAASQFNSVSLRAGEQACSTFSHKQTNEHTHTHLPHVATDWLVGEFLGLPPVNVLVYGLIGHGKTTIVNHVGSMFSLGSECSPPNRCMARGREEGEHVSVGYRCVPLALMALPAHAAKRPESARFEEEEAYRAALNAGLAISVWDTPGCDKVAPGGGTSWSLFCGNAQDGAQRSHCADSSSGTAFFQFDPRARMHAILFVAKAETVLEPTVCPALEKLCGQVKEIVERSSCAASGKAPVRPIVALTFADQLRCEEIGEAVETANRLFEGKARVVPISNYTNEGVRCFEKDVKYFELLRELADEAQKQWNEAEFAEQPSNGITCAPGETFARDCGNLKMPLAIVKQHHWVRLFSSDGRMADCWVGSSERPLGGLTLSHVRGLAEKCGVSDGFAFFDPRDAEARTLLKPSEESSFPVDALEFRIHPSGSPPPVRPAKVRIINDTTGHSFEIQLPSTPDQCTVAQLRQIITDARIATGAFVFINNCIDIPFTVKQESFPSLTVKRIAGDDGTVHFKSV